MPSTKQPDDEQNQQDVPPKRKKRPVKKRKKSPVKQRRMAVSRRDILILASVWLVGCGIVSSLLAVFYFNTTVETPVQPIPTAAFEITFAEGGTAKPAYLLALKEAQTWQGDVEMVAVSKNWSNVTVQDLGQAAGLWDFRFYSVRHSRIFFAVISPEKQIYSRAHIYKSRYAPTIINPANWIIDSDEAMTIWLNRGGAAFLGAFPENSVEILLRQTPNSDNPSWEIVSLSGDQSQTFYLAIDAADGQILNQRQQ